jgi:hypothetical protein
VLVPPHDLHMATAYDDSYNLTPARLLRNLRGLGYRGAIVHYVGMSHYYRLERQRAASCWSTARRSCAGRRRAGTRLLRALRGAGLRADRLAVVRAVRRALPAGVAAALRRRSAGADRLGAAFGAAVAGNAGDGVPAGDRGAVRRADARGGLPVSFQIGEPWWWTTRDGRIALYDDAARALFGGDPPVIADLRLPLSARSSRCSTRPARRWRSRPGACAMP